MEIWNEFCSYLIDCKERDVSEERYHEIIESQLSVRYAIKNVFHQDMVLQSRILLSRKMA